MQIRRAFTTIQELKTMLDGYRKLFNAEPVIRITASSFTSTEDDRILFNRLSQGYSVGSVGNKYITLVFDNSDGEDTTPFRFDPADQEETLVVIFE